MPAALTVPVGSRVLELDVVRAAELSLDQRQPATRILNAPVLIAKGVVGRDGGYG